MASMIDNLLGRVRDPMVSQGLLALGGQMMQAGAQGMPTGAAFGQGMQAYNQAALQYEQLAQQREERMREKKLRELREKAISQITDEDLQFLAAIDPSGQAVAQVMAARLKPREMVQPTDDQREYQMAVQQGYKGSFFDYQRDLRQAGATNISYGGLTEAIDPTTGQRVFVQPSNRGGAAVVPGITPPPPAAEAPRPIPAEITGRLALGESFASQVPDILASIQQGATEGLVNRGKMAAGIGVPARIVERQQSGIDALIRNLTGAGMTENEAKRYAARYQISPTDGTTTQTQKVLQLSMELSKIDQSTRQQYKQPLSNAYQGIPMPMELAPTPASTQGGWSIKPKG